MKKLPSIFFVFVLSLGVMSCTSSRKVNFYHAATTVPAYITVIDFTSEEIGFRIKMWDRPDYLYHIILNEEEEHISEGWFWTSFGTSDYTVSMEAKRGFSFEEGKPYRLCVGYRNPDVIGYPANQYQCAIYWEFTVPQIGERR